MFNSHHLYQKVDFYVKVDYSFVINFWNDFYLVFFWNVRDSYYCIVCLVNFLVWNSNLFFHVVLHLRPLSLDCHDNLDCLFDSSSSHYCDCTCVFLWNWYWVSLDHQIVKEWILNHFWVNLVVWMICFVWSTEQVSIEYNWLCWMNFQNFYHHLRMIWHEPVYFLIFLWMVVCTLRYNDLYYILRCVNCEEWIVDFNQIQDLVCTNTLVVRSLIDCIKVIFYVNRWIFWDINLEYQCSHYCNICTWCSDNYRLSYVRCFIFMVFEPFCDNYFSFFFLLKDLSSLFNNLDTNLFFFYCRDIVVSNHLFYLVSLVHVELCFSLLSENCKVLPLNYWHRLHWLQVCKQECVINLERIIVFFFSVCVVFRNYDFFDSHSRTFLCLNLKFKEVIWHDLHHWHVYKQVEVFFEKITLVSFYFNFFFFF